MGTPIASLVRNDQDFNDLMEFLQTISGKAISVTSNTNQQTDCRADPMSLWLLQLAASTVINHRCNIITSCVGIDGLMVDNGIVCLGSGVDRA